MHHLGHARQAADDTDEPGMTHFRVRDQAKKCGLADAVGADQSDSLTITDLEGDAVEERSPAGERIANLDQLDETHAAIA